MNFSIHKINEINSLAIYIPKNHTNLTFSYFVKFDPVYFLQNCHMAPTPPPPPKKKIKAYQFVDKKVKVVLTACIYKLNKPHKTQI